MHFFDKSNKNSLFKRFRKKLEKLRLILPVPKLEQATENKRDVIPLNYFSCNFICNVYAVEWSELNAAEQEAAMTLGFDRDCWNSREIPDECKKSWSELLHTQQVAAYFLGIHVFWSKAETEEW